MVDELLRDLNANYAESVDTRKSLSRYVFTLFAFVICWKANLQLVVALSTTLEEYITLTKGVNKALWLKEMMGELGIVPNCD